MLNKVMLIGYVGADSEMKFTPGGIPVTNFSLAVNETYKNGGGDKKTSTLWIRCVAWRRWAEIAGEFVGKGKFVYVEGRLQLRNYEDREGRKHDVTEVVVSTLRFLGPSKNGNGAKAAESSKPSGPVDENESPFNEPGSEGTEEDSSLLKTGSLFGAHIRAIHPDLLRDSNFLLPRSGSNSFDSEGVRVSSCMSRFGDPQNPRWRPLMDGVLSTRHR
jgi:single-strand DNA-binding protein